MIPTPEGEESAKPLIIYCCHTVCILLRWLNYFEQKLACISFKLLAAWRSGNGVGRINEVTPRRARLVLGWVTCPGSGGDTLFRYVTSHPGRLSLSSFRGR